MKKATSSFLFSFCIVLFPFSADADSLKTFSGLAKASIKTVNVTAAASVKTVGDVCMDAAGFVVTTRQVTDITETGAISGGTILCGGSSAVTARGVCWSTSANPTTADSKTTDGTGTGAFTSTITGLTSGTPYYVRAYATNTEGTVYGNQYLFTPSRLPMICLVEWKQNGNVYTSVDGGSTWTTATTSGMGSGANAASIGILPNRTHIILVANSTGAEGLWFSTNGGTTFGSENTTYTAAYTAKVWVTSTTMYANGGADKSVWYSTNGTSVAKYVSDSSYYVSDVCASSNGQYLVRAGGYDASPVKRSVDTGANWSDASGISQAAYGCFMSSDGATVFVGTYNKTDMLYKSTDYGATFASEGRTSASAVTTFIRGSSDGKYLLMIAAGKTWVNNNYGNSANWIEVLTGVTTERMFPGGNVSPSGKYMILGESTTAGTYYFSDDFGVNWSTKTVSGVTATFFGCAVMD
jgi:hypothetical protein